MCIMGLWSHLDINITRYCAEFSRGINRFCVVLWPNNPKEKKFFGKNIFFEKYDMVKIGSRQYRERLPEPNLAESAR